MERIPRDDIPDDWEKMEEDPQPAIGAVFDWDIVNEATNMTDLEMEMDPHGTAGSVLNPANHDYVDDDVLESAGRVLGGHGSKEDEDKVVEGGKNVPKNPDADRRDREQKENQESENDDYYDDDWD